MSEKHNKILTLLHTLITPVDAVLITCGKKGGADKIRVCNKPNNNNTQFLTDCKNCGGSDVAWRNRCCAFGQQCNACKKMNHFRKCCRFSQAKSEDIFPPGETESTDVSDDETY